MSEILPGPAYRIETRRLILRCRAPQEAPLLVQTVNANLDHLRPWMPWADRPADLAGEIALLRRFRAEFDLDQDYAYGIWDSGERHVLGGCGLHTRIGPDGLEIGYWIDKGHVRQGLATEAAGALARVAFIVHRVQRVEIHCDPRNLASAGVARKLGFTHTETRPDEAPVGDRQATMIWVLSADDFPHSPAAQIELQAYDCLERRLL
ncbi:MAG: GNAT family N-acetyltransferase [Anaerolineae bacterium]|nr:GNAT family N-acetyltransferase [Anaerolineae bacterium]